MDILVETFISKRDETTKARLELEKATKCLLARITTPKMRVKEVAKVVGLSWSTLRNLTEKDYKTMDETLCRVYNSLVVLSGGKDELPITAWTIHLGKADREAVRKATSEIMQSVIFPTRTWKQVSEETGISRNWLYQLKNGRVYKSRGRNGNSKADAADDTLVRLYKYLRGVEIEQKRLA